jgi:hypothetical protein
VRDARCRGSGGIIGGIGGIGIGGGACQAKGLRRARMQQGQYAAGVHAYCRCRRPIFTRSVANSLRVLVQ